MHYEQKKRPFRKQRQVELDRAIHLKKKKRFGGPKRLWHTQQQVAAQNMRFALAPIAMETAQAVCHIQILSKNELWDKQGIRPTYSA